MKVVLEIVNETAKSSQVDFMNVIANAQSVISLATSILTLIGLLWGTGYIHTLRNKQESVLFGFWSQLRVKLEKIGAFLENDNGLINNIYEPDKRETFEGSVPPKSDQVVRFKKMIDDLDTFLQSSKDQLPAYKGWNTQLNVIIEFITNMNLYDLTDSEESFVVKDFPEREAYCKTVVTAIKKMCSEIKKKQNKIENRIFLLDTDTFDD